jgi:hypothetical protein
MKFSHSGGVIENFDQSVHSSRSEEKEEKKRKKVS